MNRRRLTIEQWRDAVLYATRRTRIRRGKSLELDHPSNRRRTVYARVSRLKLNDLLMQFDYPDANVHAEQRSITTTAIQAFSCSTALHDRARQGLQRQADGRHEGAGCSPGESRPIASSSGAKPSRGIGVGP